MILRLLLALLIGALVLVTLVLLLQRRMLYFPDTRTPSLQQLEASGLESWPAQRAHLGWIGDDERSGERGTVVVFHGNAGAAWQRDYYVAALQPLGFKVVLAEYPGYGGRPGKPSEETLVADGLATVAGVEAQFGGPIYLWGESLGAGVAAAVAAGAGASVSGLVLLTPWDSLPSLAQALYPLGPFRHLLLDQYDSITNLAEFAPPVAVLIATEDEIIPGGHSQTLFQALGQPKRLWKFQGAGHNSWPAGEAEGWWEEVMNFVTQAGKS